MEPRRVALIGYAQVIEEWNACVNSYNACEEDGNIIDAQMYYYWAVGDEEIAKRLAAYI